MKFRRAAREYNLECGSMSDNHGEKAKGIPMMFGRKRKTFSVYDCAVARSTACFASTTSIGEPLRRLVLDDGMAKMKLESQK